MSAGQADRVVHGSVRAVRTFRLASDGGLLPVTPRPAWSAGTNTAVCQALQGPYPRGVQAPAPHTQPAPAPGCRCGLWGFGNMQALRESGLMQQRQPVAVIRCHGVVVPGALGLRAQHAVVEAVWLSRRVDDRVRAQFAQSYPRVAVYRSLTAMLSEHPPTPLPSYRLPSPPSAWNRLWVRVRLALTFAWWVGLLAWTVLAVPATLPTAAVPVTPLFLSLSMGAGAMSVAALVLSVQRRGPRPLFTMVVAQTVLLVFGQALLDEWSALFYVAVVAVAGLSHLLGAALACWDLARDD